MTIRIRRHGEQDDPDHQCDDFCRSEYGYEDEDDPHGTLAKLFEAQSEEEALAIEATIIEPSDPQLDAFEGEVIP